MTTLAFERQFATCATAAHRAAGRAVEEAAAEAEEYFATYAWYPQRAGRADLVPQAAELAGRTDDPFVRQQIAGAGRPAEGPRVDGPPGPGGAGGGRPPGSEGSLGKLAASRVARPSARAHP